ncbi:FAD-binding protein [Deminuibacter soli]|uniref:FAD-binding protein n=1 Tax=Deminuibacter soli TaxID=2291815 RepID=A0A3E1NL13_9BACT|nr:FAD-binding protein [Deminuibacter soli]RFM28478.1 FAD-binding protein [Deminuibacter soli]
MMIVKSGKTQWQNRHEVFTQPIKDLYFLGNDNSMNALDAYNDATVAIQKLIADAIQQNTTLRALGSGWSWTKIATTGNNGIMLDTKPLNSIFTISQQQVSPDYKGDVSKLVFAQCGAAIWELSQYLQIRNLSLKTSGASNGQTIAGAIGSGAHGSAFDFGAVQDFVVGLHIVVGPNRHIFLERKSAPVAGSEIIQKLKAELVQDDALFYAALISMGCFGFVHGVMIETESLYLLECYMRRMPYDANLKKIMETLDFSNANLPCGTERPFHFAVQINPYDIDKGVYVTSMYKRPYTHDYQRASDNQDGIGPGDDAACFVGRLTQAVPAAVPFIVNKLLAGALTPYEKKMGTLGEIFDNTTLHGKLLCAAIGIPISFVNKVVDILLPMTRGNVPYAGLFALRYVKKSNATLAFTRFDTTCILELDAVFSDATLQFYSAVWDKLEQANIPFTFHWGKMTELDPDRLKSKYGAAADSWLAARNQLLDADTRNVFTNPVMQQWGLDK